MPPIQAQRWAAAHNSLHRLAHTAACIGCQGTTACTGWHAIPCCWLPSRRRFPGLCLTWQDSPSMGRENMTANAPGSQGGKRERRMPRVVSWVPRGVACMALSRRVRSMMAS